MILTRLIVSVVVCAYCMDAQEPFGSIRGRTLDVTGSAIAGVAVKAVAQGTGVTTGNLFADGIYNGVQDRGPQ